MQTKLAAWNAGASAMHGLEREKPSRKKTQRHAKPHRHLYSSTEAPPANLWTAHLGALMFKLNLMQWVIKYLEYAPMAGRLTSHRLLYGPC